MFFAVLWVLSPLALIPALIIALNKKGRLESFVNMLFRCGRIDREEYISMRVKAPQMETPPQSAQNISPIPPAQPFPQTAQGAHRAVVRPQPVQNGNFSPYTQPDANFYANSPFKKKENNSSQIMLIIGVIFVILAGVVFSTAAWLYMSDIQRTGVVAIASAFFFGVSVLARRKLKLDSTSSAFYMLGGAFAAITVLTAGYFGLFGEWLSVDGDGAPVLFALSALTASAVSLLGVSICRKKAFAHAALYSGYTAFSLICVQISGLADGNAELNDISVFALLMSVFSAVLIAADCFGKLRSDGLFGEPLKAFVKVSAVIGALSSLPSVLVWEKDSALEYILICLYLAETAFYGYRKKSVLLNSALALLAADLTVSVSMSVFGNQTSQCLLFAVLCTLLAFAFRFAKPLRTVVSDYLFAGALALDGFAVVVYDDASTNGLSALIFIAAAVVIMAYSLEKNRKNLALMRLAAPIPIMLCANQLAMYAKDADLAIASGCFALLALAAVAFAFNSDDGRFRIMQYSFGASAAFMLFAVIEMAESLPAAILAAVFCAALFAVCMTMKNNILSAAPSLALYYAAWTIADIAFAESEEIGKAYLAAYSIVFILLLAASRLVCRERLIDSGKGRFKINAPAFAAILAPILVIDGSYEKMWTFIAVIELSLFALNLYRPKQPEGLNRAALAFASAFGCIAFYDQPFFTIENETLLHKLNIIPVLLFGLAVRTIWRKNKKAARDMGFAVNLFALLMLVWDALYFEDLFNTLFVLLTALALVIWSFAAKNKRWFITSSVTLIGVTVYVMRDFLGDIEWWVYLLFAGILLIGIAAGNEYLKSRGGGEGGDKSRKEKLAEKWEEWK